MKIVAVYVLVCSSNCDKSSSIKGSNVDSDASVDASSGFGNGDGISARTSGGEGSSAYFAGTGSTVDSEVEAGEISGSDCPWTEQADLDDEVGAWAIYTEGNPTSVLEDITAPSTGDDTALRCGITGGDPYSNVHCYRNIAIAGNPRSFVLRMSFWYSPPSTFNNSGKQSIVQAVEFSFSKWWNNKRYELALQWQNVGAGAPQWRYWDSNQPNEQRWIAKELPQALSAEQWHTFEIRGEALEDTVHYQSFSVDETTHSLDLSLAADATPGEIDRLSVAVQLDGNSDETPYDLVIDNVLLATCDSSNCPSATVSYQDLDGDGFGNSHKSVVTCETPVGYAEANLDCDDDDPRRRPPLSEDPDFDLDRCGQGNLLDGMEGTDASAEWQIYTDGLGSSASVASATGCNDEGMEVTYSLSESDQPNWIVLRKELPSVIDLSGSDFLLLPFQGDPTGPARTIEVKLEDSAGCRSAVPFSAVSTLPVFRTAVISLQQFTRPQSSSCSDASVDLTQIQALEIGVSEVGDDVLNPESAASGILTFDDVTFVARDTFAKPQDFFECVTERGDVLGRIAISFVKRQKPHGFIPSWYPESTPNYYSYTEALNLIVLSKEYNI